MKKQIAEFVTNPIIVFVINMVPINIKHQKMKNY